jgi:hypothetical protein
MVLQVGLQPVLGDFGCVLGGQATKSTVLIRPKDLFVLIMSWEARFPWTRVLQVGLQPALGDFGCVLGGQATKSTVCVRPKTFFKFWTGMASAYPAILVLVQNFLQKVNQGPVLFLETLQSPVDFFWRAKLLVLPHKFCILPTYCCKYQWFVYIR